MDLNSTINTLVPIILLIVAVSWVYYKFREPVSALYDWIKRLLGTGVDKVKEVPGGAQEIVYR